MSNKSGISTKVHVKFSKDQLDLIRQMKGPLGDTDSEVVRSICIAWLAEKELLADAVKRKIGE